MIASAGSAFKNAVIEQVALAAESNIIDNEEYKNSREIK